jgi:hypothetical protein
MQWLGPRESGGPGFNHLLATSKPGTLLYAPISLGSHGALAFWPLAAAAMAGGIELVGVVRARRQLGDTSAPGPGMSPVGLRPAAPGAWPGPTEPSAGPDQHGADHRGGPDPFGGDPGRAAL